MIFIATSTLNQWEFQDPKMEVLYHIKPYFWGISLYIAYMDHFMDIHGRYLQFRFLKWPLITIDYITRGYIHLVLVSYPYPKKTHNDLVACMW